MKCLFCKEPSQLSKSVEHTIPEALGNRKHILPQGLVCDQCNNYFSRKVEKPILSHQSMRNLRGYYQIPNKKGKLPSMQGHVAGTNVDISFKLGKNRQLIIEPEKAGQKVTVDQYIAELTKGDSYRPFIFPIDIDPPKKEMSRFLAMMALETVALRFTHSGDSEQIVEESHFDPIRNYARYGTGVDIWPYHCRTVFPAGTKMRHPETGDWVNIGIGHDLLMTSIPETYFVFMLYGVEFVINLGGSSIKGYEVWLKENNNISPIIERTGARLFTKVVNGIKHYYLDGDFNNKQAIAFDMARFK